MKLDFPDWARTLTALVSEYSEADDAQTALVLLPHAGAPIHRATPTAPLHCPALRFILDHCASTAPQRSRSCR